MSDYNYNEEEPGFFQKYRFVILALVVVLIAGGVGLSFYLFKGTIPPPKPPAPDNMVKDEPDNPA